MFWHPKGWRIFQQLIGYMRKRQDEAGYGEVNAPEIMESSLWQKSGHLEKFGENMFLTKTPDERVFAIKPMNCPGHIQIFNQGIRSYKDLPIRFAEFGKVHRYEPSGALHGLMRVRAFNQDDAHIFITEDQITEESVQGHQTTAVDLQGLRLRRRGGEVRRPAARSGWVRTRSGTSRKRPSRPPPPPPASNATTTRARAPFTARSSNSTCKDAIGRTWQCGTLQVDLNLPGRLGATYIDEHSQRQTPVMLHRAIFGSLERFFGILLEHHAGKLPAWLAPTQAVVMNITDRQDAYVQQVAETLRNQGIRSRDRLAERKGGL